MIAGILALLLQTVVYTKGSPDAAPEALHSADAKLHKYPDAKLYDEKADANAAVDAALVRVQKSGKRVIIIMGGNWCHDSRALAGWFETPRFKAMLDEKYELVYVDAGTPQLRGKARNQHLVKRFKGKKQQGTPYVMLLSPDGRLLNRDEARSWRNAASRSEDEIYRYFAIFTPA
jgi:hypothetical protein